MILSEAQIGNLHEAVKECTNERTVIMAIPGTVMNQGRQIPSVEVTIGHNPTQKLYKYVYRGISSNFKSWLKERVDKIENQ